MAQKKSYSRYFIILQEDEKGYALASDKLPSGYAKLEIKNDKCKVSYYVQNLNKESAPYFMLLICSKKDVKKLLKIGELNIDEHGRAEVSHEYPVENIANCEVNVDKIIGAAVVRFMNSNIIPVMSGFASNDVPEWRNFAIIEGDMKRNEENVIKQEEQKVQENTEDNMEVKAEEIKEVPAEEPKNIFDEYEEKIEKEKSKVEHIEEIEKPAKSMPRNEEEKIEEKIQVEIEVDSEDDRKKKKCKDDGCSIKLENTCEDKHKHKDEHIKDKKCEKYNKDEHLKKCKTDKPKGSVGTFFMDVADGFEELHGICNEIKRCSWYKVPAYTMEDMACCTDYNKYTVAYYPMVNYYSYISKFGHFLLGYKKDKENKMKYLVYGIAGTKSRNDQPYAGRTGFVTWVPLVEGKEEDNDYGYWLMFYDFRNSTIVIPVK